MKNKEKKIKYFSSQEGLDSVSNSSNFSWSQQTNSSSKSMIKKHVLSGVLAFLMSALLVLCAFTFFNISEKQIEAYWSDEGVYAASFAGGDGSAETPYQIATPAQLGRFAALFKTDATYRSANYILTADLNMTGNFWEAVGSAGTSLIDRNSTPFTGSFDGNNFTISNLTNYLFGGVSGTVKNLTISEGRGFINVLRNGTVENCTNLGSLSNSATGGGIVNQGYAGTISNCVNHANVTRSNNNAGGIVGEVIQTLAAPTMVSGCKNYGDVGGTNAGGIIGLHGGGGLLAAQPISNCENYGSVSGTIVGGIVGNLNVLTSVIKCLNQGGVSGSSIAGGIVGATIGSKISNCYNKNDILLMNESFLNGQTVNTPVFAGGIVGVTGYGTYDEENFNNTLTYTYVYNCYNTGKVASFVGAGGIVGGNGMAGQTNISNCFNVGEIATGEAFFEAYIDYALQMFENDYQEGLDRLDAAEAAEIAPIQSNWDRFEADVAYVLENWDTIVAEAQADIDRQVEEALAGGMSQEEAESLRAQLEAELQEELDSYDLQVETTRQEYANQIAQIQAEYDAQRQTLQQEYEQYLEEINTSIETEMRPLMEQSLQANANLLAENMNGGIVGIQSMYVDNDGNQTLFYGSSQNSYYGGLCENIGGVQGADTESIYYVGNITELAKEEDWYSSEIWEENNAWRMGFDWQFVEGENDGYPVFAEASSWENFVDTDFAGEGTETSPYLITSAEELAGLAYLVNNGEKKFAHYLQTTDIDLGAHYWVPIGHITELEGMPERYFSGVYDGGGHVVKNLNYDATDTRCATYTGLFAVIIGVEDESTGLINFAEIKNLGVSGSKISTGAMYFGGVVSTAINAKLSNCWNEADIENTASGLGGMSAGVIMQGEILYISGLYNTGDISSSGAYGVGGMLSSVLGTVDGCYNTGNIIGQGNTVALFSLELADENAVVSNCYNTGRVEGTAVGVMPISRVQSNLSIINCGNTGEFVSTAQVPIFGTYVSTNGSNPERNLLIENCYNTSDLTIDLDGTSSGYPCGVFFEYMDSWNITINNCFNTGDLTSNSLTGGFIGSANQITITDSYFSGRIEAVGNNGNYSLAAGFVWTANSAIVEDCYFNGQIIALSGAGIIGEVGDLSVTNTYVFGTLAQNAVSTYSTRQIGGIVANATGSATLTNNFVFANLSSTQTVGGLIGASTASEITIENCVFEGNITVTDSTSDTYAGGFIGSATGCSNLSITGSYINTDITVASTNAYASGMIGSITMSDTSSPAAIDKCAVVANISTSAEGEMTNSREFYFSPNLVDSATILNSYALFNNSLTISDTTTGMDGYFAYLDNFQNGLPIPIGLYYITAYGTTTGIVDQLQKFVG